MRLIEALKENRDSGPYPFHMPGHKRVLSNDDLLAEVYGIDITETEGFDNLHDAQGIIKEAEERAAALFGADETHFLVNGSTGGILASVCGTVTCGDMIIVAGNCHRSVYNAVMLSGAKPYIVTPDKEKLFGIFGGITKEQISGALKDTKCKTGNVAVVITSPTYEGITSDIAGIAAICHESGAVLIVDAAHGAHFGLSDAFPASPVSEGADVVITSVHKTLPSMTQTALIHINKMCRSKEHIRKMLPVFSTSSPSYVLMASIDSMTALLEDRKKELFDDYTKKLNDFYKKAGRFKSLAVLTGSKLSAPGSCDHDMGKIVVGDSTATYTGERLSRTLREEYGICAEMATKEYVILMTSIADSARAFEKLYDALRRIDEIITAGGQVAPTEVSDTGMSTYTGLLDGNMKEAMLSEAESVPVGASAGRIAADFVSVYPPGIPELIPGEKITKESAGRILEAINTGLDVVGLTNGEISVIWEKSST